MDMFHRHSRGKKRPWRKSKSKYHSGVRLIAFLLCLSMLTGTLPALAQTNADEEKLSAIVNFDSITLHYADSGGQPGEVVQDGALIEKDTELALRYTYSITGEQCESIQAGTSYYLDVSPHLKLPTNLNAELTLTDTTTQEDGTSVETKIKFGTLHADGSRAWVTFLPDTAGTGTVLSEYGGIENAYFYLDCNRAENIPDSETPIDGKGNLYAMKFENIGELHFGYAEKEPVKAKAQISKGGSLTDKTITWTINYTPWQNPGGSDPVTLGTPFELRDTIDTSQHSYVEGSVKIDGQPVTAVTSRDAVPLNAKTYVLVEPSADGAATLLTFGGTKFNAGQATRGEPAAPLKITYQTSINDDLLLPGSTGGTNGKRVTNTADLFAKKDGVFSSLSISSGSTVTIPQPTWVTKTGKTTRDYLDSGEPNGSHTKWTVTFQPSGFSFTEENNLTLHDRLPGGSTLVEASVKVDGAPATVNTGEDGAFTISGIETDNKPVSITYTTRVPEEMYDSGTNLGSNVAWFTFDHGDFSYSTPEAKTPVGSGDGSGTPGTATIVKTNSGYNAANCTIDWTVKINLIRHT